MTGSGDIAPVPAGNGGPAATAATVGGYLLGTFAGLIALAVVATMFMTAEYRRNLIRVTLAASPRRGRALAAKAVVIGAVAFVTGLAGAGIAVLAGTAVTHARGTYQFPVTGLTEARLIIATGVLAALSAVFALAVGSIVRRSAVAVTIVIVTVVLPYFLSVAAVVPSGAVDWLLRITPAAGFAVQAPYPRYPQVSVLYSVVSGYYPLGPWTGLAVLCGWTAVALAGAACCCAAGTRDASCRRSRSRSRPRPAGLARPGRGARTALPDAVHAEWTKLRTLAGTWWLLAAAVAVTIAAGAAVAGTAALPPGPSGGAPAAAADPARISLAGVTLGQAIVALLAVLAVGGEYGTGMIRVTLAATPRRMAMLTAKAVVVTGGAAAAGAVAVLGSVLAGRLILPGRGLSAANGYAVMSLGNGPDLRAAAGWCCTWR